MKAYTFQELQTLSYDHPIIAFDGVCNLCNSYVNWLISRDKKKIFRYTTLQSEKGQLLNVSKDGDLDTVVLALNGNIYTHSDVALQSMKILGGGWKVLSWLSFLPKSFRDWIYNIIAKNRYRWFGEKEACMIPSPEVRELFI